MAYLFLLVLLIFLLALPVGLMKPTLFQSITKKLLGKDATRKNLVVSFSVLSLVSFVGIGFTAPTPVKNEENKGQVVELSEGAQSIETSEPVLSKTIEEPVKVETKSETVTPANETIEPVRSIQPQSSVSTSSELPVEDNEPAYTPPVYEESEPTPTTWYSCSSNIYNCSNFSTHAEAQSVYDGCWAQTGRDVHGLDGNDNDGLACESLP